MQRSGLHRGLHRIQDWPLWAQYALSIGAVTVALVFRLSLDPWLSNRVPFVTIFLVILPLAMLVRPGPFLVGAVLGCFGALVLFVPPRFSLHFDGPEGWLQAALSLLASMAAGVTAWLSQRAQRRGRSADAMLRAFVDDSPTCKWVTDAQGRIVYVNSAMAALLGRSVQEIVGRTHAEILPPRHAQVAADAIAQVRATGQPRMSIEDIEPFHGKGSRRILEWRRFALRLDDDDQLFIAGMANDVTEKVRVEGALRESEARFRLMADVAPVLIWLSGTDKLCTWFNKTWLDFVGRSLEKEIGNGWAENVHPDDFEGCLRTYTTAFDARQPFSMEYRLRRHDGEYRWILDNGVPRHEPAGEFAGYIGSCIDITDRKRAEQALRAREAELESIINETPFMLTRCSRDLRYTFVSAACSMFLGRPREEIIGKPIVEILGEEAFKTILPHIKEVLKGNVVTFESAVPYRGIGTRVVSVVYTPEEDAAGNVTGWIASILDVTERKEHERQREQWAADLAIALAKRTEEVTRAERAMANTQRMAAVGTLASGLAHDIKNVLFAFSGRMDRILADSRLTGEARTDLTVIIALIDHLRQMAKNLSLFVADPKQEGAEGRTDLGTWVQGVKSLIEGSLRPGPGQFSWIKTVWDVPQGLPAVNVAPHRLTQVVLNLVQNARDAVLVKADLERGGGEAKGCIIIRARAEPVEGRVELKIIDNGCGMTEEVRRRSVEPFFTTRDRPDLPGGPGSGMGLSLAIATVERVGGQFKIESQPGQGTTITILLPVAPTGKPTDATRSEPPATIKSAK